MVRPLPAPSHVDGCSVWQARLDAPDAADWGAACSEDERVRARRFVFPHHRDRFLAAHGFLRLALAAATGAPPASFVFRTGPFGKPLVHGVEFNLSHSDAFVAVAVGPSAVGVDVEALRPMEDWPALAEQHFTPSEIATLHATPAPRREQAFLRCWTRKEAVLKAAGLGLSVPTRDIEVSPHADTATAMLSDAGRTLHLRVHALDACEGAVASLARVIHAVPQDASATTHEAASTP